MSAELHRINVNVVVGEDGAAELFGRLHSRWPQAPAAFLDSSDHARTSGAPGAPRRNRYSILAFALGPKAETAQPTHAWEWLARTWRVDRAAAAGPRRDSRPPRPASGGAEQAAPPFQLGWVGFAGYENQGRFFRATHAVVVDHAAHTAQLQTAEKDPDWEAVVRQELRDAAAPAAGGEREWAVSGAESRGSAEHSAAARPPEGTGPTALPQGRESAVPAAGRPLPHRPLTELRVRDGRADYLAKIGAAQKEIVDGNSYEVCLTTAVTGKLTGSPWQAYLRVRAHNRAPFTQYLYLPGAQDDITILSSSPERFMQISSDGMARSEPIKGTRPRSADPSEDMRLRHDLAEHPKDRAENVMITDLVRNDLSVHAVPGTLRTERLCAVETYPTVHQMVSTVSARLQPHAAAADAVSAAFPPGSMTGAPKISTMEILRRLESGSRGPYSGAAGYFSSSGACDLSVLIRTAVLSRPAGDSGEEWSFHLGLGGAITADSSPEDEWQEIITKSRGVLGALGAQFPLR